VSDTPASDATPVPNTQPNPEAALDLDTLLSVVSEDDQVLLVLNYAHGLSNSEIGKILDVPEGNIKSQIHRAKQKIRQHFQLDPTTSGQAVQNTAIGDSQPGWVQPGNCRGWHDAARTSALAG
jgi:DNA-directed RNA polymerase specialized sigma24 family protein